jgi:kynurenine formamidase
MATPTGGADLLNREGIALIDLSRRLYEGMPLWPGHQLPFKMVNQDHEGFKRLDVSDIRHPDYFTPAVLEAAEEKNAQEIHQGDIVLLYSGHGDRTYPQPEYIEKYAGLDRAGATWLAERGVVNIGVDAVAIDQSDDLDFSGHAVCAEYQIVNTENLTNLDQLVDQRFVYYGLPLPFGEGTGSPIRAVAHVPR